VLLELFIRMNETASTPYYWQKYMYNRH
jgi:hypothetical protein